MRIMFDWNDGSMDALEVSRITYECAKVKNRWFKIDPDNDDASRVLPDAQLIVCQFAYDSNGADSIAFELTKEELENPSLCVALMESAFERGILDLRGREFYFVCSDDDDDDGNSMDSF